MGSLIVGWVERLKANSYPRQIVGEFSSDFLVRTDRVKPNNPIYCCRSRVGFRYSVEIAIRIASP